MAGRAVSDSHGRCRRFLVLALFGIGCFIWAQQARASTVIPNDTHITTDTTWTELGGAPCLLQGNLWIDAGATLTIEPGVVIKFACDTTCLSQGKGLIYVNGRLNARGTASKRLAAVVGAWTTKYAWDQNYPLPQLAVERDGSGALLRRCGYGLERLSLSTPTADFFCAYDPAGSVANLTDSTTSPSSVLAYTYEPYGVLRSSSGSGLTNPIQYKGEYADPTSGLENLRARQYDPQTGRFLSLDPLRTAAESGYAFAGDNPMAFSDPSGTSFCGVLSGHSSLIHDTRNALLKTAEIGGGAAWDSVVNAPRDIVALPGNAYHCVTKKATKDGLNTVFGLSLLYPAGRVLLAAVGRGVESEVLASAVGRLATDETGSLSLGVAEEAQPQPTEGLQSGVSASCVFSLEPCWRS